MHPRRRAVATLTALALGLVVAAAGPGSATAAAPRAGAVPIPAPPSTYVDVQRDGIVLHDGAGWVRAYRVLRAAGSGPEVEVAHDVRMPWTDTDVTPGVRYTYRVRGVDEGTVGEPSPPITVTALSPVDGNDGEFVAIRPVRVLDTRYGPGPQGRLGPGGVLTIDPTQGGAVPATGVSAVLLNLTGTEASEATHVRIWPAGDPLPDTSSLNLLPGQTRANQVVVPVDADGRVSLYNNSGWTHLVVDVQGFYTTADGEDGAGYTAYGDAIRFMDTRTPGRGQQAFLSLGEGALRPWEMVWVPAGYFVFGEVSAVDVNLTVTEASAAGHLVAWDGFGGVPVASNVNFAAGQTVPNHAVVPTSTFGGLRPGIMVRNNSPGTVHLIIDVQGHYDHGGQENALRFRATPTVRIADTRTAGGRVAPGAALVVAPAPQPEAPVSHVVNVTATQSTGPGHLIGWTGDGPLPNTSVVNFQTGEDSPNMATIGAGADGAIRVTPGTSSTHVVVDRLGYFY